jgi:hypothetical protein
MNTLPNQAPPAKSKRWAPCAACGRVVATADIRGGSQLVVEICRSGLGDIGLTNPLFEGGPLAVVPNVISRYRAHRCKGALASTPAFSAENFDSKRSDPTKSPTDPNISYRTFPPKKRRGKR